MYPAYDQFGADSQRMRYNEREQFRNVYVRQYNGPVMPPTHPVAMNSSGRFGDFRPFHVSFFFFFYEYGIIYVRYEER